jgi:polyhydroxyalkanoate synthesis regulator phasin
MNLAYLVEALYEVQGKPTWVKVVTDRLEYCRGYLHCLKEMRPHPAYRLVRTKDGKIMEQCEEVTNISIGMIAGWPTGAQVINAVILELSAVYLHRGYTTQEEVDRCRRAIEALKKPMNISTDNGDCMSTIEDRIEDIQEQISMAEAEIDRQKALIEHLRKCIERLESKPVSCNLHDDSAQADAQAVEDGRDRPFHCRDDECSDCFGD